MELNGDHPDTFPVWDHIASYHPITDRPVYMGETSAYLDPAFLYLRIVRQDYVAGWFVSTIWLPVNYNPDYIFETMVFPPNYEERSAAILRGEDVDDDGEPFQRRWKRGNLLPALIFHVGLVIKLHCTFALPATTGTTDEV